FATALREAVTIYMDDRRRGVPRVLVHDRERWRADFERISAELRGDRARQKRFARAEVTGEVDNGVGREEAGDLATGRFALPLGASDPGFHRPRSSFNSPASRRRRVSFRFASTIHEM